MQEPDMEDCLRSTRVTDATGRTIAATVLSKTDTALEFRRTGDGTDFENRSLANKRKVWLKKAMRRAPGGE